MSHRRLISQRNISHELLQIVWIFFFSPYHQTQQTYVQYTNVDTNPTFSRTNVYIFRRTHGVNAQHIRYAMLKSDVTRRDHVSVVMDAGSRIVNFIRDGTVFA